MLKFLISQALQRQKVTDTKVQQVKILQLKFLFDFRFIPSLLKEIHCVSFESIFSSPSTPFLDNCEDGIISKSKEQAKGQIR